MNKSTIPLRAPQKAQDAQTPIVRSSPPEALKNAHTGFPADLRGHPCPECDGRGIVSVQIARQQTLTQTLEQALRDMDPEWGVERTAAFILQRISGPASAQGEAAPQPERPAGEVERLREALEQIVEEKCDYMRINNLGDPETQHTVKAARAALAATPQPEQPLHELLRPDPLPAAEQAQRDADAVFDRHRDELRAALDRSARQLSRIELEDLLNGLENEAGRGDLEDATRNLLRRARAALDRSTPQAGEDVEQVREAARKLLAHAAHDMINVRRAALEEAAREVERRRNLAFERGEECDRLGLYRDANEAKGTTQALDLAAIAIRALPAAPQPAAGQDVRAFAKAIRHGDDEHRAWLMQAAEAWIAGTPLPPPRSAPQPAASWRCACGWRGNPQDLKPNPSGHLCCPTCGASGGLAMTAAPQPAAGQEGGDNG